MSDGAVMTKRTPHRNTKQPFRIRTVDPDILEAVRGGEAAADVTAPRDPATGMPTGKRM